jgi:hypothetical protein
LESEFALGLLGKNHVHHFERKTGMRGRRTAAHLDADLDRFEDFGARRCGRPL